RRIPYIQQTQAADCGPACLAMVLGFHGRRERLEQVRDFAGVGREGASAATLIETAGRYHLRARAVRVDDVEHLHFLPMASVLHWRFSHFVVFVRKIRDGIEVMDPATGRRRVSMEELQRNFTGIAISFSPTAELDAGTREDRGVHRYLRSILSHRDLLTRIVVLSVLLQCFALGVPVVTGLLVDRVVPRGDRALLHLVTAGIGALVIFDVLAAWIRSHLLLHLRTRLDAQLTLDFLDHLVDLPFSFFQRRSAGDLMMRLNSNAQIREILTSSALSGLLDGVLVCLYLMLLLIADLGMAGIVMLLAFLRLGIFLATRRRYRDLMASMLSVQAISRNYQVQMLGGIETLKGLGAEKRAVDGWSNLFVDELNISLAQGRLSAAVDSLLQALARASPLVILVYGGQRVLDGDMSLGTMLALSALGLGFLTPLGQLIDTAIRLQQSRGYFDRIDDVLETEREQDGEQMSPTLCGAITVEKVGFRYSERTPMVLTDLSLTIEPGSFVALVGPSGAGKTTLANLLLGLYPPTTGRILFDGLDLSNLDLRSVRAQLGLVNQQPHLFSSSIRDNIALADPSLPLERIMEAARRARIHDEIVAMPMGYETLLADGGMSLSGGQRQRIALARALVHRPALLLLDEATSSLDTLSERHIQAELEQSRTTRIVIAHRLSTVVHADLILVMKQGRIVEQGRHDQLLALGGHYAELALAQFGGVARGSGEPLT
ncbi:MAG: peptidase domain-containing ABC transporter, partial [Holophagales bacterium]|nr:peptidase domain-containing ABC transporter [Holophagales bacterium]